MARSSTGGGAPGAPGAGTGPAKGIKRKEESSSSSGSSSDSSDSDSSSESGAKKKNTVKKTRIKLLAKKKAVEKAEGDGDAENNAIKKKDRSPKETVVVDLLCRWWYALPDWPPNDPKYYDDELNKLSLRRVSVQEWEWVSQVDDRGRGKCYELSQFRGIFRKNDGEAVDIRPKDTCPSYNNFMKKDLAELYNLLVKAYENQIKELVSGDQNDKDVHTTLVTALNRIRLKADQANQMKYATGAAAAAKKA